MIKKYNQTGITVKIHTNHAGVRATAITLRSTAVSSSSDLRSSQWRKPQVLHQPLFEWKIKACSDILSHALSARPHQSLQPSVTALSSRAIFMFRWIRLSFIHKTLALNCLFSTCHVKELACFYEPQFGRVSLNISLSDSVLETKRLHAEVLNYSSFFFLLQNVNFDGLTFLTALVLYSQSDYLNHSNRDSDWLIVACFMRV